MQSVRPQVSRFIASFCDLIQSMLEDSHKTVVAGQMQSWELEDHSKLKQLLLALSSLELILKSQNTSTLLLCSDLLDGADGPWKVGLKPFGGKVG